uniref:Sensory neuron membrane protein 1 n=1 Tax=Rhodnius prolixus TaxID=13249 RepID=T1IC90_RHOPR
MVNLQEGNDIRNVWKAIPYLFNFNIYVFNITNPMEVQNGATPIVKEIGPYRYKEFKEKVDLVDDVDEGTITYSNMNTWYFQKEKTLPLTGDEVVTIPHLPLWSMLLVAESDFPSPLLSVVNAGLPKIYGKLKTVFMTATVNELLFKGVLIDCSVKDFLPKILCVAIKQNSKPLQKLGNNRYLFSVLGPRNATPESSRVTVKNGVGDAYSIGKVIRVNGKSANSMWLEGDCNRFAGTDATIFPPFRRPDNNSVVAYSTDVCRSIFGTYEGDGEYRGIQGHKYVFSLGDTRKNRKDSCYCLRDDACPKKGAIDLMKCQGAPLVGTFPHFYDSDESFLRGVIGLKPIKEKHELSFLMEPVITIYFHHFSTSATPLVARKRFQFNLPLHPIRYVNVTRKIKPTLMPILWLEENLDLDGELMDFLEANLLSNLRLANGVKWTLIVLGVSLCFVGVFMHQKKKLNDRPVIRVTPSPSGSVQTNLSKSTADSREQLISPFSKGDSPFQAGVVLEPSLLKEGSGGYLSRKSGSSEDPENVSRFAGKLYERLSPPSTSPPVETISRRLQHEPQIIMSPVPSDLPPIETPLLQQRKTPPQPSAEESGVFRIRGTEESTVIPIKSTHGTAESRKSERRKAESRLSEHSEAESLPKEKQDIPH